MGTGVFGSPEAAAKGRMLGKEAMYRRSRALRAAVANGWDDGRIARALARSLSPLFRN